MTVHIPFDNTYARLPERFYSKQPPTPVPDPALFALNDDLARFLGLDPEELRGEEGVRILAGNAVPDHAAPLAQAYAGHQFGGWVPQLGDGRAVLLGEVVARDGRRYDIQLKGAGPTPFSRMGDGRAWLGPVLREYLVSEAMHALGIPTTRALAAVTTGESVLRETTLPGAILTRVASSHVRVGTFQYFAARGDREGLQALADHVITRHYRDAEGPEGLLDAVVGAQARLIARWMGVGFIHGVMNTDNMSVAGETIDYGPCAFMDEYHPARTFSSIDQFGRYAYARQPEIALWNLAQLANCLLPLMPGSQDDAVARATEIVNSFAARFQQAWLDVFRAKIGLVTREDQDTTLIGTLLDRMAAGRADFTNTFRALASGRARDQFPDPTAFDDWNEAWQQRRARDATTPDEQRALMLRVNPAVIPRNHRIEAVIASALGGDRSAFDSLHAALRTPFIDDPEFCRPPTADETVTRTFCGT